MVERDKSSDCRRNGGNVPTPQGGSHYTGEAPRPIASYPKPSQEAAGAITQISINQTTVIFVPLDYREVAISGVSSDPVLASRTPTAVELLNSKTGSGAEIDKIELWLLLTAMDTSGAANDLNCATPTNNQLQLNVAAGGAVDCPFAMNGGITGQFVDTDLTIPAYGTASVTLMAEVTLMGTVDLQDLITQAIALTLKGAVSTGAMRLKVATHLRVLYNGEVWK